MKKAFIPILIFFTVFCTDFSFSQSVTILEETMSLDTYGFGHPNPVPILTENPKIMPYFKYEGYEQTSQKKDWKVVTLENDYIKVFVLPEIGGKVWGAIEKSTGEEFLYKNEVVKFRNIAMRGPWTSGGIEFNFGIIGHHPMTATPVDYKIMKNEDGSVSCIVGTLDLPSRTTWQVEIKLEKDKAYFETNASWYNGTPLNQSYYNWMTAAAAATDDLEFFIPGNAYLGHSGDAHSWPIDGEGRNLALYRNNNFGPSKSYHIVGEYKDFFGGYYHKKEFGFGHWSPYEEMPGQKLWLWDLSRAGGIWEDLLTDTDGQYIEFQAGRLFNQYSPGEINPISQANFDPYVMDRWNEIWFPYKQIGGMAAVSEHGVLNVKIEGGETYVGLNALQALNAPLTVLVNGVTVFTQNLQLKPMEVFSTQIAATSLDQIEIFVENANLHYTNDPKKSQLKRPFKADKNVISSENQQLFMDGWEAMKFREYALAREKFNELLQQEPSHLEALVKLAELEYRRTNYQKALEFAQKALQLDTYNAGANYFSGLSYKKLNDSVNALESLGWAARDIKYRAVSYAVMAEIYFGLNNLNHAATYALKALDYNTYNLNARYVLLLTNRKSNNPLAFETQLQAIRKMDALDHFVEFESILHQNGAPGDILKNIQNEFPDETLLELALKYLNLNEKETALQLLALAPKSGKANILAAYLLSNIDPVQSQVYLQEALKASPDFVFPYRAEMIPVLEWAISKNSHWKLKYYLAQNDLAVGLQEKGEVLLRNCGFEPDNDTFYRFRGEILKQETFDNRLKDFQKALTLKSNNWKIWEDLIRFYFDNGKFKEANTTAEKAYKKFTNNYNIGLSYAKTLVSVESYAKSISILKSLKVLPYEHAAESKGIYDNAHIFYAQQFMERKNFTKAIELLNLSKEWPEHLGVGQPFDPDTRLQDYLLSYCYQSIGKGKEAETALKSIVTYTEKNTELIGINSLFSLLAFEKLNQSESLKQYKKDLKETATQNEKAALAVVLYEHNENEIEALKRKINLDEKLWSILHFVTANKW